MSLKYIDEYYRKYILKEPCMTFLHTGEKWVNELLSGHDTRFYNAFRMFKTEFLSLHKDFEDKYEL